MKKAFFFAPFLQFYSLRAGWLVLLLIALLPTYAQVGSPRNDWVVGVNAGVQMNKVLFQPNIRQTYLTAPTIGLTARYTSEKYFSMICAIQVELNYARLGWKEDIYSSQSVKLADTYERHIDYLQLPILANLGFGREQRGVKGFLLAGPQLGYALKEKELRSSTWTTRVLSGTTVPDRANNPSNIISTTGFVPDWAWKWLPQWDVSCWMPATTTDWPTCLATPNATLSVAHPTIPSRQRFLIYST